MEEQTSACCLLWFFSCRQSLRVAELTFFLSANSTEMCFQPSSYPVPGWLGLTSAREADHLLGFSVCSWEGGLAEQITKQAPAPAPARAGLAPRVVGEALPAQDGPGAAGAHTSGRTGVPMCPWAKKESREGYGQGAEDLPGCKEGFRKESSLWDSCRLFSLFRLSFLDGEGQGSLLCCSPWGRKESDITE